MDLAIKPEVGDDKDALATGGAGFARRMAAADAKRAEVLDRVGIARR